MVAELGMERLPDDPDYKLRVTIRTDGIKVSHVSCKVYLPKAKTDPVVLVFSPTRQQANLLVPVFECSIEGHLRDLAGVRTHIRATKVYLHGPSTKYWGRAQWEVRLEGAPTDLSVVRSYPGQATELKNKVVGTFWLTRSLMLEPYKMIEHLGTGEVRVQTVRQVSFKLQADLQLNFDTHYQHTKNEAGHDVTFPELVAVFERPAQRRGSSKVGDNLLQYVDDFLRIVSFAERQQCVCVGWEAADKRGIEAYFRRNIAIPSPRKEHSLNDVLIDIKDFQEFAQTTYDRFVADPSPLVRQALTYALYREDQAVENSFMTLYAAIETLLLHYRRANGLENALDRDAWESVARNLKQCLRTDPRLSADRSVRQLMYEKLPELNRVSFGTAFRKFCDHNAIDLGDLWPVGKDPSGISLSDIRNKLVHGEHFIPPQIIPLIVALQHLRWVVERMILAFFGWPVARSTVRSQFLAANMTSYQNWREHQRSFSA